MKKKPIKNKDSLRILMCTSAMEMGGAETHIFELSKKLILQGHKVMILSGGGMFAEKLEKLGALREDIDWMSLSFKKLPSLCARAKKIVKSFSPDIVHSHSRIPSLVMSYVCKKEKIPHVTTDHAKFDISSPLTKYLTRWGEKTVAVSSDLKEYLLSNFKSIKEKDIFVTVNGIDTERFCKKDRATKEKLCDELCIERNSKIILSVSRLDNTAYLCVYELLDIAKKLYERFPDSHLLIAGAGNVFEDVCARAELINKEIGKEYIKLLGARSDTDILCGVCDVFVGCARSAIEAISCRAPAIICGNGEYLGVLSKENIDFCTNSNFTARGCEKISCDTLFSDICSVLENSSDHDKITLFARELICKKYSVEKMVEDCKAAYFCAIRSGNTGYDCVITGYYGHGNSGDDALLLSVISNLRKNMPHLRICVLCKNSKELKSMLSELDVSTKGRFNIFTTLYAFARSSSLIFGGGTLLQDNTSTKSLLYYILILRLAKLMGLGTMLYANGIGPLHRAKNAKRVAKIIPELDTITLRDENSLALLQKLGVKTDNVCVTADEVLTNPVPEKAFADDICEKYWIAGIDYFVVSVRSWSKAPAQFYERLELALHSFCENTGLAPVFLVMEREHDFEITQKLSETFDEARIVFSDCNLDETVAICTNAKYVISMRLHALVYAALGNVALFGLVYDPKVESFLRQIGADKEYIDISDEQADLEGGILDGYRNFEYQSDIRAERINILKDKANNNSVIAQKFLENL